MTAQQVTTHQLTADTLTYPEGLIKCSSFIEVAYTFKNLNVL